MLMTNAPITDGRKTRLVNGRYVDIWNLQKEDVDIDTIAHSLGNLCRYGGHIPNFYSVAEHSYRVMSKLMFHPDPAIASDPVILMQALLHDAAESFLVDVPRPIKYELSQYRELEQRVEYQLFPILGLPYPLHRTVKEADDMMLSFEWKHWVTAKDAKEYQHWSPEASKYLFLDAYYHLQKKIDALPTKA